MDTLDYTMLLFKIMAGGLLLGLVLVVGVGLWLGRDREETEEPNETEYGSWRDL